MNIIVMVNTIFKQSSHNKAQLSWPLIAATHNFVRVKTLFVILHLGDTKWTMNVSHYVLESDESYVKYQQSQNTSASGRTLMMFW